MGNLEQRVIAYFDGLNLYHSLKDKRWQKYYWLDILSLMDSFIEKERKLIEIKYFTSYSWKPESMGRQRTYLKALQTESLKRMLNFSIQRGVFIPNNIRCNECNEYIRCSACGNVPIFYNGKNTDVNLAVEMVADAFQNNFDSAFLVTEDSDQVGTILKIAKNCPGKKIFVIFPPGRHSDHLSKACLSTGGTSWNIGEKKLKKFQLPDEIILPCGSILKRPIRWH